MNTKNVYTSIAAAALLSAVLAIPAFAQTPVSANHGTWNGPAQGGQMRGNFGGKPGTKMTPAVFGTVSAISGDSITLTGRAGFGTSTPSVTYTVDATNAKVTKANATSSVSSIAVGDTLVVQGTVTGTSVVATNIRDGVMRGGQGMTGGRMGPNASSTSMMQGDGQPVVGGKIATMNGDTLTVTNSSNVSYTVDATNAKVLLGNTTSSIANVKVGDEVIVQGAVNGTSINATSVIDQSKPATPAKKSAIGGFFGAIGGFFGHLFGF
jgi:hypothetical protein